MEEEPILRKDRAVRENDKNKVELEKINNVGETNWKTEIKGYIYALIASLSGAVSSACVKALNRRIPDLELNGFRFITVFLMCLPFYVYYRKRQQDENISTSWSITLWSWLFAFISFLYALFLFTCVTFLSLGEAISIMRIASTMMLACMSWTVFKTKINFCDVIGIALGAIGIILVYNKQIFKSSDDANSSNCSYIKQIVAENNTNTTSMKNDCLYNEEDIPVIYTVIGVILALLCAVVGAADYVLQKLKLSDVSGYILSFWCGLIGIVCSFMISITFEHLVLPATLYEWLLLLGHCLFSALFSIFANVAQEIASTQSIIRIAVTYSSQIAFYFLLQYIIFEAIVFNRTFLIQLVGAVIIIISINLPALELYISWIKRHKKVTYDLLNPSKE